jgi:hypothetical protein
MVMMMVMMTVMMMVMVMVMEMKDVEIALVGVGGIEHTARGVMSIVHQGS